MYEQLTWKNKLKMQKKNPLYMVSTQDEATNRKLALSFNRYTPPNDRFIITTVLPPFTLQSFQLLTSPEKSRAEEKQSIQ
jgi:hypothetical protein